MCLLRVANVDRPILSSDVLFIRTDDFARLGDETYFRVLASDKRDSEISKSYFYFIVNKLRSIGLLIDNAIGFKVVLPFTASSGRISLGEGMMFVTDDRRLIYYNPEETTYMCGKCPVTQECLNALRSVVKEVDIKVRNEKLDDAWLSVIEEIKSEVISNLKLIRGKAELGKIELKERSRARVYGCVAKKL